MITGLSRPAGDVAQRILRDMAIAFGPPRLCRPPLPLASANQVSSPESRHPVSLKIFDKPGRSPYFTARPKRQPGVPDEAIPSLAGPVASPQYQAFRNYSGVVRLYIHDRRLHLSPK